jgi:hypothetical protein
MNVRLLDYNKDEIVKEGDFTLQNNMSMFSLIKIEKCHYGKNCGHLSFPVFRPIRQYNRRKKINWQKIVRKSLVMFKRGPVPRVNFN